LRDDDRGGEAGLVHVGHVFVIELGGRLRLRLLGGVVLLLRDGGQGKHRRRKGKDEENGHYFTHGELPFSFMLASGARRACTEEAGGGYVGAKVSAAPVMTRAADAELMKRLLPPLRRGR